MCAMRQSCSRAQTRVSRSISTVAAIVLALSNGVVLAADGNTESVDGTRIANADHDPGNWLTYGRTYSEQRYSPLTKIAADNASRLGLAWFADLDTNRGQEATPLVIDGVMCVSTAWGLVKAYGAPFGKLRCASD